MGSHPLSREGEVGYVTNRDVATRDQWRPSGLTPRDYVHQIHTDREVEGGTRLRRDGGGYLRGQGFSLGRWGALEVVWMSADRVNVPHAAKGALRRGQFDKLCFVCVLPQ